MQLNIFLFLLKKYILTIKKNKLKIYFNLKKNNDKNN